jgi:hypothetical protein
MSITVGKTLPSSDWYSGSGAITVTLSGANDITFNSKKSLIKIQIPKAPSNSENTSSDKGVNYVKDLKKVEDSIKLRGWLADNASSSAWNQAWQLRGMSAVGGPVSSLVIENLTFSSGTQEAFLEDVSFICHTNRVQGLRINETNSSSVGVARIEADLSFYLGDSR